MNPIYTSESMFGKKKIKQSEQKRLSDKRFLKSKAKKKISRKSRRFNLLNK